MRRASSAFQFAPFSSRQRAVLSWWMPGSGHEDKVGIIADGSIRSGKTIAFILGFVLWSTYCFTGENFIISGKTIGALKRNVVAPMLRILAALGIPVRYNRSENYLEFGGNVYYLFGANTEASQDTLQGITAAGWLADEVALHPQSFIEQAIGRCSVEGRRFWLNCNPEGPFHYVKTDLIDLRGEKGFLRLHFTLEDNLTLSPQIKADYERMFSGLWYKRFILGLWVAAEGAIFDMFDPELHVVDELPAMRTLYVAADYATGNPTVFLLCGEGVDGVHYAIDEYRWDSKAQKRQKTDAEYSADLKTWLLEPRILGGREVCRLFPTAAIVDPSAASLKVQLRKDAHGFPIRDAKNDVLDGIRLTGSLFHLGKLKLHRRCSGTIKELVGYVWDEKARNKGIDKPIKVADHGVDALRYYTLTTIGSLSQIVGL